MFGTINRQGLVGLVDEVMLWNRTLIHDEIVCASGPACTPSRPTPRHNGAGWNIWLELGAGIGQRGSG